MFGLASSFASACISPPQGSALDPEMADRLDRLERMLLDEKLKREDAEVKVSLVVQFLTAPVSVLRLPPLGGGA